MWKYIAFMVIILDQMAKYFMQIRLSDPVWFFDGVGFEKAFNKGVAFSLPLGGVPAILLAMAIIIILLIFAYKNLNQEKIITHVVLGLIIGGAVGNIIDRIAYGYVRDFIRIGWWPTFNVADSCIVIGGLIFVIFYDKIALKKTKP